MVKSWEFRFQFFYGLYDLLDVYRVDFCCGEGVMNSVIIEGIYIKCQGFSICRVFERVFNIF